MSPGMAGWRTWVRLVEERGRVAPIVRRNAFSLEFHHLFLGRVGTENDEFHYCGKRSEV